MKISEDNKMIDHDFDVVSLIEDLKNQYRTVYWFHEDGEIYIYKPLGRRDYKEICEDENLSTMDKEDEVIKRCLLYPTLKDNSLDNMVAGIAKKLFETIMKNSFLTDINSKQMLMNYYRSEMYDLQNQVTCLINEAFPNYDIEEIENWDIERTSKYLSRAEWKLQNLRGMVFNEDYFKQQESNQVNTNIQEDIPEQNQNIDSGKMNESAINKEDQTKSSKKPKFDAAKMEEMKRRFPEIKWEEDEVLKHGIDGLKDSFDTTSVALRPGS